jgi:hypothetical protein
VTRPLSKKILAGNLQSGEILMSWNGVEMEILDIGDSEKELH